jgi:iron complex outermembrane recepter protein
MALIIASGTTGVAIFRNGIDTRTHGADLVFIFPTDYAFGHVNCSVRAEFNETNITKIRGTPAQVTGLSLYNATALSDLTTVSPKCVVNLGALKLFDRYPNKLNDVLRSHYDNLAYNDNLGGAAVPVVLPVRPKLR